MFQLGGELELMLRAQPNEQQILFRVGWPTWCPSPSSTA
jgi:hypothetical protein